jgi:iron-sulfur cluster assembly enzyme ISCU, mitochondrial
MQYYSSYMLVISGNTKKMLINRLTQLRPILVSRAQCVRRYHETVHDHFNNPRNVGKLDKADPSVGTAIVGKAACGDVVQLQIKVENGVISDARFKTFGCGSAIASASYATEVIKGKSTDEVSQLKNTDISSYLKLPPVKIHCSLLVEEAVKTALEDYNSKQMKVKEAVL